MTWRVTSTLDIGCKRYARMKFKVFKLHPSVVAIFDVGFLSTRHFRKAHESIYEVVLLDLAKNRNWKAPLEKGVRFGFWIKKGDLKRKAWHCRSSPWHSKMTWHFAIGLSMQKIWADEVQFGQTSSTNSRWSKHRMIKCIALLECGDKDLQGGAFHFCQK